LGCESICPCSSARWSCAFILCFFFQAEDGIRDFHVTGVQTCALPISYRMLPVAPLPEVDLPIISVTANLPGASPETMASSVATQIGRASCRERVEIAGVAESLKKEEQ